MHIQKSEDAIFSKEYGGIKEDYGTDKGAGFRRLFPWADVSSNMPWGSGLMVLAPGTSSTPHSHHEYESFYIVSGEAQLRINAEIVKVSKGDVVFVQLDDEHELTNRSKDTPFEYLCTWWDAAE